MYNTQEIKKLNHFSEYSTGGHRVDSLWTAEAFFEIMDISFFVIFREKRTRVRKSGLLISQKFRLLFCCFEQQSKVLKNLKKSTEYHKNQSGHLIIQK